MEILCPDCEDPTKLLWVNVSEDRIGAPDGRFRGYSKVYIVEEVEQRCDCDFTAYYERRVEEAAIEAYKEGGW